MNQFDLIVVGGGPAGLSAAYTAAESGLKVIVLERSREIGYPIHTSGGSWIDELSALAIPSRFMHPIDHGIFVSPNAQVEFSYDKPPSCILDVRGLYQYLAELASSAGAKISVNTNATEPLWERNQVFGVAARRAGKPMKFHAPLVVDASGFQAVIARKVGLTDAAQRFGIGAEYDLYAPQWPSNQVAFLFGSRFAPSGYAWVFPHGQHRVRFGVGIIRPDSTADPKWFLDRMMADPSLFHGALSKVSQVEYHSGTIPSQGCPARTVTNGLMVVGDAGRLISTLLGEGIRFAIDIGRLAGKIAGSAVREGRFDQQFLMKFDKAWRSKYERIFKIGAHLNRRLAAYSDQEWDDKIRLLSTLKPALLPPLLKGDVTVGNLGRTFLTNPRFFTTYLKTRS